MKPRHPAQDFDLPKFDLRVFDLRVFDMSDRRP
jgi:hypothetical protein